MTPFAAPPLASAALAIWGIFICRSAAAAERSVLPRIVSSAARYAPYVLACSLAAIAAATRPASEALVLGAATIAIAAAAPGDIRTGLLFDAVTRPAAIAVIALSLALGRTGPALAGVACVAGFFGVLFIVSRGRWMGLGDVKAIFAISAAFGPIEAVLAIFVACLSGIALAALRPASLEGRTLPFGPHLAAGACAILVAGPSVEHAWMHVS